MKSTNSPLRPIPFSDALVVTAFALLIYAVILVAQQWKGDYQPVTQIDLSLTSLPGYALLSALRGFQAYVLSLVFTLVIGYMAAKSKMAERILIPMLDILQSVPTLGFLPGLVLGLLSLFPNSNIGLELTAVILIFSGQVWNMVFCYYASLKSIPLEYHEAAANMGLSWWEKMWRIEIPASVMSLSWNSLLSMAGGWFYLTICEAFVLGTREFRLPGIGAYMAEAIKAGNTVAMIAGILAMGTVIVLMDILLWRPILVWARRFRWDSDDSDDSPEEEPLMKFVLQESFLVQWFDRLFRRYRGRSLFQDREPLSRSRENSLRGRLWTLIHRGVVQLTRVWMWIRAPIWFGWIFVLGGTGLFFWGLQGLWLLLSGVSLAKWSSLGVDLGLTTLRVFGAVALASLWAIPFGVWVGISQHRIRVTQPIIQVLASFPAPMIYPLLLSLLFWLHLGFGISAMFLMFVGVQWYVLFNVLAGSLRIPKDLVLASRMMGLGVFARWKNLYLPSIFPDLVAGWVTAAGGAWNASIVAEYMEYQGTVYSTRGLGAALSQATNAGDLPQMAATLTVMIVVIVLLNRFLWAKLFELAETRFRLGE